MGFKYTLQCDTLPWVGYNVLEEPDVVLQAAAEAGYDGVDLPGNPARVDAGVWRRRVEQAGLAVPEVLAAWGYYHAGEERNLASSDPATRARAVQYAKDTVDLAADLGASFTELCAAQPAVPQLPFPIEPVATLREQLPAVDPGDLRPRRTPRHHHTAGAAQHLRRHPRGADHAVRGGELRGRAEAR